MCLFCYVNVRSVAEGETVWFLLLTFFARVTYVSLYKASCQCTMKIFCSIVSCIHPFRSGDFNLYEYEECACPLLSDHSRAKRHVSRVEIYVLQKWFVSRLTEREIDVRVYLPCVYLPYTSNVRLQFQQLGLRSQRDSVATLSSSALKTLGHPTVRRPTPVQEVVPRVPQT